MAMLRGMEAEFGKVHAATMIFLSRSSLIRNSLAKTHPHEKANLFL